MGMNASSVCVAAVAAGELPQHPGLPVAAVRGRRRGGGAGRGRRVPLAARLDRLHLLHHRAGGARAGAAGGQGALRLLGLQERRLPALARQQDAAPALRLALRVTRPPSFFHSI